MKYAEKFKDPRWQKMRLKILERDNFACQICHDNKSPLHVHHRIYTPKTDPWDYDTGFLVTLCEDCHENETREMPETIRSLAETLQSQYFSEEINSLVYALDSPHFACSPERVSEILAWALNTRKICEFLEKEFQKGYDG